MISIADISLRQKLRASFVGAICFFIVAAFMVLQSVSLTHTHDNPRDHAHVHNNAHTYDPHDHEEEPRHQSCDVCILAVNDDAELEYNISPKTDDDQSFVIHLNKVSFDEANQISSIAYAKRSTAPPRDLIGKRESSRAPPYTL